VVVAGTLLAWRNLRQRRGDRTGAIRVGATVFFTVLLSNVLVANHAIDVAHELGIAYVAISQGLTQGAVLALVYLALEPYVRRRWPDRLISWARLLAGRWRDPMVGRDLLIGIAGGMVQTALSAYDTFFRELLTGSPAAPFSGDAALLGSSLSGLAKIPNAVTQGILVGLGLMIALMLFTIVLRRRVLGVAALFLMYLAMMLTASQELWMVPFLVLEAALFTLLVARFGLLTIAAAFMTFWAIFFYPLPDAVAWYTMRGLTTVFFIAALAVWAFHRSLGGQRAFSAIKLDEA
jgi:hypothetical protein